MSTLAGVTIGALKVDNALTALATGGIWDADSTAPDGGKVGYRGMRNELMMTAGDPVRKPAIYLSWSTDVPFGVAQRSLGAQHAYVEVYYYQDNGYDIIRKMSARVRQLLAYKRFQFTEPADYWVYDIFWAGDVLNQVDVGLNVCFERSRYQILYGSTTSVTGDC